MFSAFTNSLKIPELRSRIFYTLSLLFVARVAAHIPLPGIDPAPLQRFFGDQSAGGASALVGLYNMFTGGALIKGAIAALGIVPATMTANAEMCVVYTCLAVFGLELTVGVSWAIPLDIGGDFAGSVSAVMNTFGNIGGAISTVALGYLVK